MFEHTVDVDLMCDRTGIGWSQPFSRFPSTRTAPIVDKYGPRVGVLLSVSCVIVGWVMVLIGIDTAGASGRGLVMVGLAVSAGATNPLIHSIMSLAELFPASKARRITRKTTTALGRCGGCGHTHIDSILWRQAGRHRERTEQHTDSTRDTHTRRQATHRHQTHRHTHSTYNYSRVNCAVHHPPRALGFSCPFLALLLDG